MSSTLDGYAKLAVYAIMNRTSVHNLGLADLYFLAHNELNSEVVFVPRDGMQSINYEEAVLIHEHEEQKAKRLGYGRSRFMSR